MMLGVARIQYNAPVARQTDPRGFQLSINVLPFLDPCRRKSGVAQHAMRDAPVRIFIRILSLEIDWLAAPG